MKEVSQVVPSHLLREESTAPKKNAMGKDDFMKLLMTQLQHQDPMKPMDHQEFGTQLAQFSQLEQLNNIGAGIQGLRTDRGDDSKLQALGMIGKKIHASGNEVNLTSGEDVAIRPALKEGVQPAKVSIYDANAKLVRELDLAGKPPGEAISWDGKNQEGTALPSGKYAFRVYGVGRDGQAQELGTELSGRVTGVDVNGKSPLLVVQTEKGTVRLELAKVSQVSLDEAATKPMSLPTVATPAPMKVAAAVAAPQETDEEREPIEVEVAASPSAEPDPLDSGQHSWNTYMPSVHPGGNR